MNYQNFIVIRKVIVNIKLKNPKVQQYLLLLLHFLKYNTDHNEQTKTNSRYSNG